MNVNQEGFTRSLLWSSLLSISQCFFCLSGSKATCQFEPSHGWECVCPKGYEGDGRTCYGNAADVSKTIIISEYKTYCMVLTLDLNQIAKTL